MKKISLLFALCSVLCVAGCANDTDTPYDVQDFQQGGDNAPYLNERSMQFMQPDNQYSNVDSYRPSTEAEKAEKDAKWSTAQKDTSWQEYHGTMVRIEVLLGSSDLHEMRLKLVRNANGMDIDGDSRDVLGKVAEFEMKKGCGRNSKTYVVVYDQPSFEVMRPTPFFDYQLSADGATMREYGFHCVYSD